ncbi:tRNA guanosine-2'-O-methyltransferase 11 [Dictyostelium discoideum AX4]|uniref:tRNA (guanine(10)-N(2))-methyltransferase TRMT11 n=1 Tax=Dictyostelium discoideum TaxID=44689 RepID=TRM11_DICDI|nr:tRNA guanosine-2'-O-methyltransferase 11 [Dictyostelium discoideum AX4]Q54QA6.1 RecName: Full=tRNA (guanine(10)-N2)-methyltransferase homolog; AltName: Full=tRNA guanosine-2'-O-methyltransferase TRM11 homolog [Dictyostelium discoideum]EAL65472.1 tRNA guanosine-2'-O-methyltransferase 11 [Dictyostelium discoideum AX4]|eukprot:XP_638838.1 tRNA guanosine-2'-O-methyltransferase 11 [Dictyostelium discoideum AX4]
MPKYLINFVQQYASFRIHELESVARLFNIDIQYNKEDLEFIESLDPEIETPFLYVTVNSEEDIKKICTRSVLIKSVYSIWAETQLLDEILNELHSKFDKQFLSNYMINKTFKIEVESYGSKYNQKEKLEMMQKLKDSPLWDSGKCLMHPTEEQMDKHILWYILTDFGVERQGLVKDFTLLPRKVYFGQRIAKGNRDDIIKYNLSDRKYLGTTSMDPELSLVSANMGLVKKGHFVLDPFVGTGSFILVASHFGAQTVGCDIDIKAMRKEEDCNLETNFKDHGLTSQFLGTILCDNSCPPWRVNSMFDSIITDPPYGIRAGARKIGFKENRKFVPVPEGLRRDHIPQCIDYSVPDVMADLLELAAKTLIVGGRLVYWLPTTPDYKETDLPRHPCLRLITASCLQILTNRWGRRLVTMEKIIEYNDSIHNKSLLVQEDLGQFDPQHKDLRAVVFWKKMGTNEKTKKKEQKKKSVENHLKSKNNNDVINNNSNDTNSNNNCNNENNIENQK